MKKLFLLVAVVAMMLPSCKKINDELDSLSARLDKLEQAVPTIEEQISAIQVSIASLEEVDTKLKESIKALEESDKATAEEITALKNADEAIEGKIEALKKYVDESIQSTKDWVNTTFATLEQLNALSEEVSALKILVEANKTEAATNLATAISNLETSMMLWVGEQLAGYYTIAEIDAKITTLLTTITNGDSALQQQLNELKAQLATTKQEITEAYKKAIEDAITQNNGVIDSKISNEIANVNRRIDNEIATINAKIVAIEERLAALEGRVNTIEEQIAAINTTLESLDSMDKELKGYIDGLTTTATNLQEQISSTNTKIDEVKTALQGEISTAKADVLAQLEALETELKNELKTINATIETLKAKDEELNKKIAELKTYVDSELKNTTDWVSATFATLEQYNALVSEVATIKAQIEAINKSISDLETRLTTKINEDIATAVSTLNADIQQKVKDITTAYTTAIKSVKEEVTAAYTIEILTAITALDSSLKSWVSEQLSGYYTIAEIDASLAALTQEFNNKLDTQKTYLEGLINELATALTKDITGNKVLIEGLQKDIATLQGESAEYAAKVAENATAIAKNAQDIINNATAITNNSNDIGTNEQLLASNKTLIEANTNAIAENKKSIDALKVSTSSIVTTNTENIATNAENIAKSSSLISKNATAIANNQLAISQNASDIMQLEQRFANIENEFEETCQRIISEAISNNGSINSSEALALNTRIDNEISTFNYQIALIATRVSVVENDIATIKKQITTILSDIADLKESISALLSRIQSVSYIPQYVDGIATLKDTGSASRVTLDFEISPKDAVYTLVKVWQQAVSIKAIYTETRAVEFIDMPIISLIADATNGIISVTASGENLSESFFNGTQTASLRLAISDGNNSVTSDYVSMDIQTIMEYTSSDGAIVVPHNGSSVISNSYDNGVGRIVFSGRLTKINEYFCQKCTTLTSVTIPTSVKYIARNAFQGCSALTKVEMRSFIPPTLEGSVFANTPSNLKIYVPYADLYKTSKSWDTYTNKIYDSASVTNTIVYTSSDNSIVTPNDISVFGANMIANTYENGQGIITFDGEVSTIGYQAFYKCNTLTGITIPESVVEIGEYAFAKCSKLSYVSTINCTVCRYAFYDCSNLRRAYFAENATAEYSFGYLSEIYCLSTTPPMIFGECDYKDLVHSGCGFDFDDKTKIYIPASAIDTYKYIHGNGCWVPQLYLYTTY